MAGLTTFPLLQPDEDFHDIFVCECKTWVYTYGKGKLFCLDLETQTIQSEIGFSEGYYEQIQFVDNFGWICGEKGMTYRTEDYGNTWEQVKLEQEEGWMYLPYAMHFFDKVNGLISGSRFNPTQKKLEPIFFKSQDGGKSWQNAFRDETSSPGLLNMSFINSAAGLLGIGVSRDSIYKSEDEGNTWNLLYREENQDLKEQFRGIHIINHQSYLVCGFSGRVLSTVNGGIDWSATSVSNYKLRSISMDGEVGYVVGDSENDEVTVFETRDRGKSWSSYNGISTDIHRIRKFDGKFYLIGKQGSLCTISP